jgi:hypothetical protein
MRLNETAGIPLGMLAGLVIQAIAFADQERIDIVWLAGAAVMIIASLVLWWLANKTQYSRGKHGRKGNTYKPPRRIPVFRLNSTNKKTI